MLAAPCEVRGLAQVDEKVELTHGLIPAHLFEAGLRWFRDDSHTERFFAVRRVGDAYRPVVPPQKGTASSLEYRTLGGRGGGVPLARVPAAPSSRKPTTRTSRRSASTASSDAWTRPNRN